MKVLVDTNVVIDALTGREPFYELSDKVIELCADGKVEGVLAAHSITNLFYYLRKHYSNDESRDILLGLFDIFGIEQIDTEKLKDALLNKGFKDFEDCLQTECAISARADYIVTRNEKDFVNSAVPCISPGKFCEMFSTGASDGTCESVGSQRCTEKNPDQTGQEGIWQSGSQYS